jgi:hypothetical protein
MIHNGGGPYQLPRPPRGCVMSHDTKKLCAMMPGWANRSSPCLIGRTYTYPQVDRLLGLTKGTAQRWLNGYRSGGKRYDPVLRRERVDTRWVTWGEFVETRLLANYRDEEDIPVQRMRRAIEVLREEIDADYPLARGYLCLEPKGRELLLKA